MTTVINILILKNITVSEATYYVGKKQVSQ